jgi:hypothetical protein
VISISQLLQWLSPLPNSKIKQTNSGETATAATRKGKKKSQRSQTMEAAMKNMKETARKAFYISLT